MPYAVALLLDPHASRIVTDIWQNLAELNIADNRLHTSYRPHITLGIADQLDLRPLCDSLDRYCADQNPFELTLSSLGVFPGESAGAIFFGVTPTTRLLAVHDCFHRFFNECGRGLRDYYLPGHWVPHCTLADGLSCEVIPGAMTVCRQTVLPIHCTISRIGVFEFPPGHELMVHPLGSLPD